jgi:hypothetical protein
METFPLGYFLLHLFDGYLGRISKSSRETPDPTAWAVAGLVSPFQQGIGWFVSRFPLRALGRTAPTRAYFFTFDAAFSAILT